MPCESGESDEFAESSESAQSGKSTEYTESSQSAESGVSAESSESRESAGSSVWGGGGGAKLVKMPFGCVAHFITRYSCQIYNWDSNIISRSLI